MHSPCLQATCGRRGASRYPPPCTSPARARPLRLGQRQRLGRRRPSQGAWLRGGTSRWTSGWRWVGRAQSVRELRASLCHLLMPLANIHEGTCGCQSRGSKCLSPCYCRCGTAAWPSLDCSIFTALCHAVLGCAVQVRDGGMAILTSVTPDFRWQHGNADVALRCAPGRLRPLCTSCWAAGASACLGVERHR